GRPEEVIAQYHLLGSPGAASLPLALAHARTGDLETAASLVEKVPERVPGRLLAFAEIRALSGDLEGALRCYERASETLPHDWIRAKALLAMGDLLLVVGDPEEALRALERGVQEQSYRRRGDLEALAACLRQLGRFEDAVAIEGIVRADADSAQ